MLWQNFKMHRLHGESKQQQMCLPHNGTQTSSSTRSPPLLTLPEMSVRIWSATGRSYKAEGGQLRSDLQPSLVWAAAICVYPCWIAGPVYVSVSVGVGVTVKVWIIASGRDTTRRSCGDLPIPLVGVCLPHFLAVGFFPPWLCLAHVSPCNRFAGICWELRIENPFTGGHRRGVTLFVSSEIETLPSAAPSLSSSSVLPLVLARSHWWRGGLEVGGP